MSTEYPTNGFPNTSGYPSNSVPPHKKSRKNKGLVTTLLAINIIAVIAVIALVVWVFLPVKPDGYEGGVAQADLITLPNDTLVLSSMVAKDNQTVYAAAIQAKGNDFEAVALKRKLNEPAEYIPLQADSNQELLQHPEQVLCDNLSELDCKDYTIDELEEVTYDGLTFTHNDGGGWSHSGKKYNADVILGITEDTVIGAYFSSDSQQKSEHFSKDRFELVIYFDKDSAHPRSTVNLDEPSYISPIQDGLVVTEAPSIESNNSEEAITLALENNANQDFQSYYLVPAKDENRIDKVAKNKRNIKKAIKPRIAAEAIRDIDLLNSWFSQGVYNRDCTDSYSSQGHGDGNEIIGVQLPEHPDECWIQLENGVAYPTSTPESAGGGGCVAMQEINYQEHEITYADINGDGFEDAFVFGSFTGCFNAGPIVTVWIFDPEQPERPYLYYYGTGTGMLVDGLIHEGTEVITTVEGCNDTALDFSGPVGTPAKVHFYDSVQCLGL